MFNSPMIPIIVNAVNCTMKYDKEQNGADEAVHFVRCMMTFSIYNSTMTFKTVYNTMINMFIVQST